MKDLLKKYDFNKIKAGLIIPTLIGVAIVLFDFFVRAVIGFLKNDVEIIGELAGILSGYVGIAISLAGYLFFALLFLWTGYMVARKYHANVTEAGITAALAYTIIAVIYMMFMVVLIVLHIADVGDFTKISYGIGGEVATFIFPGEDVYGMIGIPCCTAGLIPLGILLNFVIGSGGAMLSEKK